MTLTTVTAEIQKACQHAERSLDDVTLIAVSKTHDAATILPVLEAGHKHFGENRVQEAHAKWPVLREQFPDAVLHLIGPLQTNKVKDAVALFDVIHTIDREKLAKALSKEMLAQGKVLDGFIQVNTGAEPQKAGVLLKEADAFIAYCMQDLKLPIKGLMCIPPVDEEAEEHFQQLHDLAKQHRLTGLSMGMSRDYTKAIACGATHVRVGTAIFGKRA